MEKESSENLAKGSEGNVPAPERNGNPFLTIHNNGRFMLPLKAIQKEPVKVAGIFAAMSFVPVRAEIVDFGLQVDYIGLSPMFRKLSEGEHAPHYKLTASFSEAGQLLSVAAEEVRP